MAQGLAARQARGRELSAHVPLGEVGLRRLALLRRAGELRPAAGGDGAAAEARLLRMCCILWIIVTFVVLIHKGKVIKSWLDKFNSGFTLNLPFYGYSLGL